MDFDWKCVLKLECSVLFVKVIEVRFIVRPKASALLLSCGVSGPNCMCLPAWRARGARAWRGAAGVLEG